MQNYQFHAHFSRTMGENQPFFIHHTYADRLSERIRVLYRNQGFLPHKWVTIVAASLPQQQLQPTKIAAYRIDSITTI